MTNFTCQRMELFLSFVISYLANNIPTVKDAVSYFGKNTTLEKELDAREQVSDICLN